MARRKLNTIKFPDIEDVYYLDADKVEFDDSATYADGSVGKALVNKANIDGYYDELTAGSAEQILGSKFVEDTEPYKFRTAGGSADVGNREQVDAIVGGSIAWNQLAKCTGGAVSNGTINSFTESSFNVTCASDLPADTWCIANFQETNIPWVAGHKYYFALKYKQNNAMSNGTVIVVLGGVDGSGTPWLTPNKGTTEKQALSTIVSAVSDKPSAWLFLQTNKANTYDLSDVQAFDLTQMFGSSVADAVYNMEQGNAGTGVKWFKSLFPNDYYAYNAGELLSVGGLQSHDTVGFNQWDEEWEAGTIDGSNGNNLNTTNDIRSKNYIPVLPNTSYYFKSPITSFLACQYDNEKNFIGTIAWGNPNGAFTLASNCHYIRIATYGNQMPTYNNDICINLSWSGWRNGEYEPYQKHSYPLDSSLTLRGVPKLSADNKMYYDGDTYAPDGTVTRKYGTRAYQSGDESLANAITDGTNTVYKLTDETTETADPYTKIQTCDDFGTEEYVSISIVPVGHDTKYPANLRDKLQHLPDLADNDGYYMIKQASKQMSLEPFRIPKAPSENGTYVLKATVSGGTPTYTWVEEN